MASLALFIVTRTVLQAGLEVVILAIVGGVKSEHEPEFQV